MAGRTWLCWILVLMGDAGAGACSNRKPTENGIVKDHPVNSRTIEEVLQAHTVRLMDVKGVVGTGIGAAEGKPCILVLVTEESSTLKAMIPSSIEGHPVCIQKVGEVKPLEGKP